MLKARKENDQRKKDEVAALFTPIDIVQPKIPFGVGASLFIPFHTISRQFRRHRNSLCSRTA